MSQQLLHIPEPCAENWNAMTPTSAGRHCAACAKTVVDFTQKTDAEMLALLAQAAGGTCGRFRAGQLARPLVPPEAASRWRSWVAALLAFGGLGAATLKAGAQVPAYQHGGAPGPAAVGGPGTRPAAGALAAKPAAGSLLTDTVAVVEGVVCDAKCEPLPGVTVVIKNTTHGTATDSEGRFQLALESGEPAVQLVFSSVGFIRQEHTVTIRPGSPARLEVPLEEDVMGLADISYRPPWPWHPRALYYWGRYQATRLFRR